MSFFFLLLLLLLAFNLSDGQSDLWKTYYYGSNISAPCIVKKNTSTSMICGGKSGSSGLNTCNEVTMNLNNNGFTYSNTYTIKKSTVLVGMYSAAPKFWTTTQNEGGYSNKKMCILNLNDGSNTPKCLCCNNDNIVSNNIQCNDLTLTSQCKQVFESCIVYDSYKERLIQIGGLLTSTYFNNISCFNISSESYSNKCEYGALNISTWYSGCTMTRNIVANEYTIIVAGGGSSSGAYIKDIQICKGNNKNCYLSQTKLPVGLQETRLYNVDNCNILIIGGRISSSLFYNGIITYDVCNDVIVSQNDTILLQEKTEFTLYIGNGYICTLGGLTNGGKYLSNIDCMLLKSTPQPTTAKPTTLMPTYKPTMKPTTNRPTGYPTAFPTNVPTTPMPTKRPTLAPTFSPTSASMNKMTLNSWSVMGNYTNARSSQACMTTTGNEQFAYVFGGIKWTSSNTMGSSNEFYRVNISNNQLLLSKYTATKTYWGLSKTMDEFYCQHQCSAVYGNKIYIVSPFIVTDANNIYFYECTVDNNNLLVSCNNLCGVTNFCNNIPFEPCITYFDNYLYIIGGQTASYVKNTILIYDMKNGSWVDNKSTMFGNLTTAVSKSSCSVWNNTVYVFGGYSNNEPTSIIQICNTKGCSISTTKLSMPRFYSQASQAIGSSIVIACGAKNYSHASEVVEMFDAATNNISIGPTLSDGNRKECCLIKINNNLMISGGQSVVSNVPTGKNSLLLATYTTTSNDQPLYLWECAEIEVEIPDLYSGKNTFKYQSNKIDGYTVWAYESTYAIWYNPNATRCCWIGSPSNMGYSYYNEFDSGSWIFIVNGRARRYSISMTCVHRIVDGGKNENDNDAIIGVDKAMFIVGLCLISVFLVCLIIGCFVWRKKQQEKHSDLQPAISKTYSGQQPVVYHTISGGSQHTVVDTTPALSSTMLFGNPKDPKWQDDVQQAIVKIENDDDDDNDDNQSQVDNENIKFVNNPQLQQIEGYLQQEQNEQHLKNIKLTTQDLFPPNQ